MEKEEEDLIGAGLLSITQLHCGIDKEDVQLN
jgi:hypothetical protein